MIPSPNNIAQALKKKRWNVVLLSVVGYVFLVAHGLSFDLTPWSQAFVNAVIKYSLLYPNTRQQETTVLLFREENLQHLDTHYPVPYEIHAQVLEALATYQPAAVFIDFIFVDRRKHEDLAALKHSLCQLRDNGTKVYLAASPGLEVLPELTACAMVAGAVKRESHGISGVLTYDRAVASPKGPIDTAAFALAKDHPDFNSTQNADLEIIWGNGVAELNRKWMHCDSPPLGETIKQLLLDGPGVLKLRCPYSPTITINHLLNSSDDPDVRNALEGRNVFYGASFLFTGDRIESPVFAELPGVYLHAMAFDNLLTFGRHYKRPSLPGDILLMIIEGALLLVATSTIIVRQAMKQEAKLTPKKLVESLIVILAILVLTALGFVAASVEFGLDAGGLILFLGYFSYRVATKAWDIVSPVLVAIVAALFAFTMLDLGPINIVAYLAFVEFVKHGDKFFKKNATRYFASRPRQSNCAKAATGPVISRARVIRLIQCAIESVLKGYHKPAKRMRRQS